MSKPRNVAILIFDDVTVLDFTGPLEVFAASYDADGNKLFNVYTVAEALRPINSRQGLSVNPAYTIDDCPQPDLIVIPGGHGTRTEVNNERLITWIQAMDTKTELSLSVCTGAFLFGKAGLLNGLSATTYHTEFDTLKTISPSVTIKAGDRFVDNGRIITSAGVSAGIDMSLYVVAKLHGLEQANRTAQRMEYEHWKPEWAEGLTP